MASECGLDWSDSGKIIVMRAGERGHEPCSFIRWGISGVSERLLGSQELCSMYSLDEGQASMAETNNNIFNMRKSSLCRIYFCDTSSHARKTDWQILSLDSCPSILIVKQLISITLLMNLHLLGQENPLCIFEIVHENVSELYFMLCYFTTNEPSSEWEVIIVLLEATVKPYLGTQMPSN